jgi:general secretion pathway protein G
MGNVMKSGFLVRRRRLRRKAGYTLVEILIVLAIIALLVAVVGPEFAKIFDGAKVKTTNTQIAELKTALDTMQPDIGRYPTQQEGLNLLLQSPGQGVSNWSGPYLKGGVVPKDAWGNDFVYLPGPDGAPPQIESFGSDGKQGGKDNAADIIK